MRARALLGAVVVAVVALTALAIAAVFDRESADRPATVVTADVSELRNGGVLPLRVELPSTGQPRAHETSSARVFFVRQGRQVNAFLGVSTHLGCALLVPGDPKYGRGFNENPRDPKIEDPCGGSTYALDGRCVGGPCPRDLDRYTVRRSGDTAQIDLSRLITGPARTH